MTSAKGVGDPPAWMNEEGQAMWLYLAVELGTELLARDRPAFALMCAVYGVAEAAEKDIHERGHLIKARTKDHSADTVDEDTGDVVDQAMVKNPSIQVAREATNQFVQYAKDFGMTPGARKRMAMDLGKRKGPGEDFSSVID